MKTVLNVLKAAIAGVAAFFLVWFPLSAAAYGQGFWFAAKNFAAWIVALGCAIAVTRHVWLRPASTSRSPPSPQTLADCVGKGAFITAGIGFVGGFVGPMILTPESNQGPMLGIFVTGPLGFVVGAAGGGIYWLIRRRSNRE